MESTDTRSSETEKPATINIAPVPAEVHLETIAVEPGSWEAHVGAVDKAIEVYRPNRSHKFGIVFQDAAGDWQLAATGHERCPIAGGKDADRDSLIWFLSAAYAIVIGESPKTTWRPA